MMQHVQIAPGTRAIDIAPDNDRDISQTSADNGAKPIPFARGLRVVTTGNVKLTTLGGDVRTYNNLPAGTFIDWVCVARVWLTGTTAALEGFY